MDQTTALSAFRSALTSYIEFTEQEWAVFKDHFDFSSLKKRAFFAKPGVVCENVGFIVSGSVRYFHVKDGEEITSYFSFENDFICSYKSYATQLPGISYIQAMEDAELITISYTNMQAMLNNPLLAYKMERFSRKLAEYYLICYEDRLASFINKTPEERYMDLLSTGKEILQRVPQHYIAHFLGITPVSLSRIRRRIMEVAK